MCGNGQEPQRKQDCQLTCQRKTFLPARRKDADVATYSRPTSFLGVIGLVAWPDARFSDNANTSWLSQFDTIMQL